ncbi:putative F-box/FBD/LRR-repeat protein At1g78760 isoform X1 [Cicer arietinum]|uniref:F-box/FBD/LRR-repeat protein At1g78760 isoform X1 n=1 Tax=Cicer arietinum TaxID=3827 RepID=A0A1S2Z7H6_CICAR|nr:putative F-box/FBD/LRR-repeat protein At1g78760 isoform X1 [Cicer arietinum]
MKTRRRNYNEDEIKDRLSDLPDCVLLHILSFLSAKESVQTCVLSTRWKNLWKYLPTLTLTSYPQFKTLKGFTNFVSRILSLRDHSTALHTLHFHRHGIVQPHLLQRIIKYAVSQNVQQMCIHVYCDIEHFPPCFFSCQTLTSLTLYVEQPGIFPQRTLFSYSLNMPALTSLTLSFFNFRGGAEPFLACPKLKRLFISDCDVLDKQNLYISSTTLVDLTIHCYPWNEIKFSLCTPSLCSFTFRGNPVQKLCESNNNLSSIKYLNIHVRMGSNFAETSLVLLNWLQEVATIKSLTISSTTLHILSLARDILKVEFPFFCNLKSLKVNKKWSRNSFIPDGIVKYLLRKSPLAEFEFIDHSREGLLGW